jgi:hypothetical protein
MITKTKISLVRLPDKTGREVQKYAEERGLAFATAVRCIVIEHLKEIASVATDRKEKR